MYRVGILFVFMFAASAVPDDFWTKCYGLHYGIMSCCAGINTSAIIQRQDINECFENKEPGLPPPFPCEIQECIAKKFGYFGDDGFDKEDFTTFIEKNLENNEVLVAAIKEKCINGDLSKYGPPDLCDIIKIQACFDNQFLKECPKWSNEGDCKGFQDVVPECTFDD